MKKWEYKGSKSGTEVSNLRVTFDYRSTEGYRISKHGVYYGAICSKNMKLFYKNFEIFPNEDSQLWGLKTRINYTM